MTKRQAQQIHLHRRAAERLGVSLSPSDSARIVRQIQAGELSIVEKQTHRVSLFAAEVAGRQVVVVYDRKRKQIVTLWERPPEREQG